jgi:anti-anti-sigma factor
LAVQLQRDGVMGIVIDLAGVMFIDNTALGVIIAAQERLRRAGGWLGVAAASEAAARMFRVAGFDGRIHVHSTAADALAAGQAGRDADAE